VLIDGGLLGASHGSDVDEQCNGTVTEQRLISWFDSRDRSPSDNSKIEFLDYGVEAFAFTFGWRLVRLAGQHAEDEVWSAPESIWPAEARPASASQTTSTSRT
jgi:Thioredoxin like C-terminal domain